MMPNQTHPAPGNQGFILLDMASNQRETNFRVSPIIIDHKKSSPVPLETDVDVTPVSTKVGDNTSEVLIHLFDPTEKNILT